MNIAPNYPIAFFSALLKLFLFFFIECMQLHLAVLTRGKCGTEVLEELPTILSFSTASYGPTTARAANSGIPAGQSLFAIPGRRFT